ncbi:MAG TPA: hypothetical protein VFA18_07045 [Gemmataceae bacterium]|nr:hypothetical protein [Gemmataceae bacterium]
MKANHHDKARNKSSAIRQMIQANPQAQSKEIVELLGRKGVKVQPSLVYYIRSKLRQQQRLARRERVTQTSETLGSSNPVELVLKVKSLARDAGGIQNLKLLVDALAD